MGSPQCASVSDDSVTPATLQVGAVVCYGENMSQPITLSDDLILDARLTAEGAERSISDQIEHWAKLGRAVESLLRSPQSLERLQSGQLRSLSECLQTVDTEQGRARVAEYLATRPFPHYEPVPGEPGLLLRIEADGKRTRGKFVNRTFQVSE